MNDTAVAELANYFPPKEREYHITAIGKDSILSLYVTAPSWGEAIDKFFENVSNEGTVQVAMRLVSVDHITQEAA